MESNNINFRLPDELRAALAAKVTATGLTRTQVLQQALRQYLGLPGDPSETTSLLEDIVARLQAIEATYEGRLDAMDNTMDRITTELIDYDARIAKLEDTPQQDTANASQASEPEEEELGPRSKASGPAEW